MYCIITEDAITQSPVKLVLSVPPYLRWFAVPMACQNHVKSILADHGWINVKKTMGCLLQKQSTEKIRILLNKNQFNKNTSDSVSNTTFTYMYIYELRN